MNKLEQLYFLYLVDAVCTKEEQQNYELVLIDLFTKEFISYDEFDDNLLDNGMGLRRKFMNFSGVARKLKDVYGGLEFPCNVLEVMIFLATDIEDTIMSNTYYGDRTGLWFWSMMNSLGLNEYNNNNYDCEKVDLKLENFIQRRYQKNGKGGLFTVKTDRYNARETNIWSQAMEFVTEFARNNGELL